MARLTMSFRVTLLSTALAFAAGGASAASSTAARPSSPPDFLAAHMDTSVDPGVALFQ